VTNKEGIVDLAEHVSKTHQILASGGTARHLAEGGIEVIKISDFTESPEMFGGRVKTLHPKIHGGILFKDNKIDREEAEKYDIPAIDLVVCNLYEFEKAVASNSREDIAIEHIDIGGPTLIRAAAKNYDRVNVLVDPDDYQEFMNHFPDTSKAYRVKLAAKAFAKVTSYDVAISRYMEKISAMSQDLLDTVFNDDYFLAGKLHEKLRYGENPHQNAAYYVTGEQSFYANLADNKPSYNNLLDLTAGWYLVREFDQPACAIIKHRSPCGAATANTLKQAYLDALKTDKMSAYGGVYVFNQVIDEETATELIEMFVDLIFAPGYTDEALKLLKTKSKMKILQKNPGEEIIYDIDPVPAGFVVQEKDYNTLDDSQIEVVSTKQPDETTMESLKFAWKVVKHSRSNAIAIAKGSRALGIGSGQTSRVDATESAIKRSGDEVTGAVLAGDAFFPFPDSIVKAADVGVKAIISPKGSIRDQQVIDAANEHGLILVFTSVRSFKH